MMVLFRKFPLRLLQECLQDFLWSLIKVCFQGISVNICSELHKEMITIIRSEIASRATLIIFLGIPRMIHP